jgi:hypothetical protein
VVAVRRAGVMPWAGVGVTGGAVWWGTVEELGECGGGLRSRMDGRGAQSTSFLTDGMGWTSVGVLSFGRGGVAQRSWARRHGKGLLEEWCGPLRAGRIEEGRSIGS